MRRGCSPKLRFIGFRWSPRSKASRRRFVVRKNDMNRATGHRFVGRDETAKARLVGSIQAKRAATMGEISETIVFIAAKAPYLTGRSIAVDGGYTAQ